MASDGVSKWLDGLAEQDQSAIRKLWDCYFERLVAMARRRLGAVSRKVADEEDVALSAFHSLCRGAEAGRFPRLEDRDDLWKLLVRLTARKAVAYQRQIFSQKRGGGRLLGESVLGAGDSSQSAGGILAVMGQEPTPEFAAQMNEESLRLLDALNDGSLRTIALLKLEGYSNEEIAEQLGYSERHLRRKLAEIQRRWQCASPPPE